MKKILQAVLVVLLTVGIPIIASANLILNSGFEDNNAWSSPADFDNWSENGDIGVTSYAHEGSYAARLGDNTNWNDPGAYAYSGLVSDNFNILEMGTYEFGAWFALRTGVDPTTVNQGDMPGITANIYYQGGGADYYYEATYISSPLVTTWTPDPPSGPWNWTSNWILLEGTFDVTQPILAGQLNITLQNYNPIWSSVYVDDAYLQKVAASVPEPATMLLFGTGLVGLVGSRLRKKKK